MKQVFITGATRGIGRSAALAFANAGYEVGFCYRKSEREAETLACEIDSLTRAYPYRCDLADFSQLCALVGRLPDEMPRIEALVNNAGEALYGVMQSVSEADFDRLVNLHVKSAFFLTQALLPQMLRRKSGSIVNLASVWGQTGASCEVLYSTCKAAVIGLTKALADELAPSGIRVNAVAPGVVDTDMIASFAENEKKEIASAIPMGRFAEPEEIAESILFLASDQASYITGQVLAVNGGSYR